MAVRANDASRDEIQARRASECVVRHIDSLAGASCSYSPETEWEEMWTGDFIFENEWQSFRTKKDRSLELTSVFHECQPGRRKIAVKVVDIFGNDTMTIIDVNVGNGGKRK